MLTSFHNVDSIEEVFHLALELELSFKSVFISKTREQCSQCYIITRHNINILTLRGTLIFIVFISSSKFDLSYL